VLHTSGFRISPAIGAVLGMAMMLLGTSSGTASIAVAGAVVVTAASVRAVIWH